MIVFFRQFQHLLPRARAWNLTAQKRLRELFKGLSEFGVDFREFIDRVWLDVFPDSTRQLTEWEQQHNLPPSDLTDEQRRERLTGAWRAFGGQSPSYIQGVLRNAGFDVYVHEWWEPGFPLDALYCGDELAECGEPAMECATDEPTARNPNDVLAPDNITPVPGLGYPLVNKLLAIIPTYLPECGELLAECGEETAECGNYQGFTFDKKRYDTTSNPDTWAYYLYIGGQNFGDLAQVPDDRRDEFENLCLKICPAQQWLGILVEYV